VDDSKYPDCLSGLIRYRCKANLVWWSRHSTGLFKKTRLPPAVTGTICTILQKQAAVFRSLHEVYGKGNPKTNEAFWISSKDFAVVHIDKSGG